MNLNREFEMARREAVTYLERKDQKTEILNGGSWALIKHSTMFGVVIIKLQ